MPRVTGVIYPPIILGSRLSPLILSPRLTGSGLRIMDTRPHIAPRIAWVSPCAMKYEGFSSSRARRNVKTMKSLEAKRIYVLGRDVYMDRVEALCCMALEGQIEYCCMGKKEWLEWAIVHWKPLLNYAPTISLFEN